MKNRFFVDERSGIVAVRDRLYTDPEYNGLHSDTPGVVDHRSGFKLYDEKGMVGWGLNPDDIKDMKQLCERLNQGTQKYLPDAGWQRYVCDCGAKVEITHYPYFKAVCGCGCGLDWTY